MSLETFSEKRIAMVVTLKDLGAIAQTVGAKNIATRLDNDLVKKLDEDRFHLVVVGEFNHGKTTFLNALLGRTILPTGVTPTTAVIHLLEYAENPSASVVRTTGDREPISLESLSKWTADRLEGTGQNTGDIAHVQVCYPSELLRQRVVLVDTPGVNDLSHLRAEITYGYMTKSDAVLFVLDAGQLLKESERTFLEDKLIKNVEDKIVFVVNKADIWSADEREEAMSYVRSHLAKIVPNPVIFAVSSQFELTGKRDYSGMQQLIEHLSRFLSEQRGTILLRQAAQRGVACVEMLEGSLEGKRRALKMTRSEIAEKIQKLQRDQSQYEKSLDERRGAIREEIVSIKAWVGRDLENLCEDVNRQLPGLIENAKPDEIKQHLGAFLEATFRRWSEEESQEISAALEALAEKTLAHVKDDVRDATQKVGGGFAMNPPSIEVDTFAFNVGATLLVAVGIGTLLANFWLGAGLVVAGPILGGLARRRANAETRRLAIEMAPQVMKDAADKLRPKLDELLDSFGTQLDQWVVLAGEEVFQNAMDVLLAAQQELEQTETHGQISNQQLDEQAVQLGLLRKRLEELRPASLGVAQFFHNLEHGGDVTSYTNSLEVLGQFAIFANHDCGSQRAQRNLAV